MIELKEGQVWKSDLNMFVILAINENLVVLRWYGDNTNKIQSRISLINFIVANDFETT